MILHTLFISLLLCSAVGNENLLKFPFLPSLPRSVTLLLLQHARTMGNDNAFFICRLEMNSTAACVWRCRGSTLHTFSFQFQQMYISATERGERGNLNFHIAHSAAVAVCCELAGESAQIYSTNLPLFSQWLISFNSLRLIISHSLCCAPSDWDWHSTWGGWWAVDKTT